MASFLLEIGVEELPARFCPLALEQLEERGAAWLRQVRVAFDDARVYGTPRRIAWLVQGLADRQADAETVARGPAAAVAFDGEGRPTRAAQGFARARGLPVEALTVDVVAGKEYVFARRTEPGRPVAEVLAEGLPGLIASLTFPRSMRWGDTDFRFPRPVRWIVALLDGEVVPFQAMGVDAGRRTFGHRTLHPGPLELERPGDYVQALRAASVLVDVEERRRRIRDGVAAAAAERGGRPRPSEDLLQEITHINEWPTAFVGRFDPAALAVPEPVLVTVMRVHQRYFPVEDAESHLLPAFVGIRNGGDAHLATVTEGNEKVLAARFADARFFYEEDRRTPLADRVSRLQTMAFAEGLGTLADKTGRLRRLAGWLARQVGADAAVVDRAAELCKADQLTHVVYELPELEGVMGAHYARADGEPPGVAQAIAEHVLPRTAGDELPRSEAGQVLAAADRLDTLTGHFLLGRQPSGSADPLGLRRAGTALIRILAAAGWDVRLDAAVEAALRGYPAASGPPAGLDEFLTGRLRGVLEDTGFRQDVVDAVLAVGSARVADAALRCRALEAAMRTEDWEDTVTAFRRAGNLARQGAAGAELRVERLGHPAGHALWEALLEARRAAERARAAADYRSVLSATAGLRRPVDEFLTQVLAMDPDPEVRRSRLALLAGVAALPSSVADLSRLAGGQ